VWGGGRGGGGGGGGRRWKGSLAALPLPIAPATQPWTCFPARGSKERVVSSPVGPGQFRQDRDGSTASIKDTMTHSSSRLMTTLSVLVYELEILALPEK